MQKSVSPVPSTNCQTIELCSEKACQFVYHSFKCRARLFCLFCPNLTAFWSKSILSVKFMCLECFSAYQRRTPAAAGIRKDGNVARLGNMSDSDDENSTYNGNSTQQMWSIFGREHFFDFEEIFWNYDRPWLQNFILINFSVCHQIDSPWTSQSDHLHTMARCFLYIVWQTKEQTHRIKVERAT